MSEKLVTVIVPVYKVENYLNRCVESILNQTYQNLEVILIDDGSPDRCPEMCDEWAQRDKRVKVIHQKNGGGGRARNVALDCAKGEYITFVDSDDYISPNMFQFLYRFFDIDIDVDIVECDYKTTENDYAEFTDLDLPMQYEKYSALDAMKNNIEDCIFKQLIWNKMYRKEVIGEIRFPEGKKIDDEFWTYQVIGNARSLIRTNEVLYAYRQQDNSVMHSLDAKKRIQGIEAKCNRHEYIVTYMPELMNESLHNIWFACMYQGQLILRTEKKNKEAMQKLENVLKKYRWIKLPRDMSISHKVWIKIAQKSLRGVCVVRNLLKVGI